MIALIASRSSIVWTSSRSVSSAAPSRAWCPRRRRDVGTERGELLARSARSRDRCGRRRRPRVSPSATSPASTSAAPPRRSVLRTGAPESSRTPCTSAWWPSMRTSAPMRMSSSANMKRFSKTFSVMIESPSASAMSAMNCACMSVGNPGYGSVCTSTGADRTVAATIVTPSAATSIAQPACAQLGEHELEVRGSKPRHRHRPAARAHRRRGRCRPRCGRRRRGARRARARRRPRPSIVDEPAPAMRAPIAMRKSTRSTISGSRAAFSMTVVPSRQHRGHEQVLGRAHAREVEGHVRAREAALGRGRVDVAVPEVDLRRPGARARGCACRSCASRCCSRPASPRAPRRAGRRAGRAPRSTRASARRARRASRGW